MGVFRVILACFYCLIALVQPTSAYKLVYSVLDASSKENALDAHGARGVYDLHSAKRARDTSWAESRKTLERTQERDGKASTSSKRKRKEEYRGDEDAMDLGVYKSHGQNHENDVVDALTPPWQFWQSIKSQHVKSAIQHHVQSPSDSEILASASASASARASASDSKEQDRQRKAANSARQRYKQNLLKAGRR
eukprot:CAMPEP_0198200744 /NCGR_PEP_ID=MMETSP1445-20131203/3705_1 /TAXON_ID=36898 /ORGANISM="Pyramimonas sp., Strain CCMP2087" /LENGTH=193 /DNA_ID=CAMNT_0043870889 /DNA_START=330 /DNA_END=907 /DNA_ORIENTATION=+